MTEISRYGASVYSLSPSKLRELQELDKMRSVRAIVIVWIEIFAIVSVAQYVLSTNYFWMFYVPLSLLIAGRQGALLQLAHEGSHGLLTQSKKLNDLLANWFCTLPVGVSFEGFTTGHLRHHAGVGTDEDPRSDIEKYRIVDFRKPILYLLLVKDLIGLTALLVFREYTRKTVSPSDKQRRGAAVVKKMVHMCIAQAVVVFVLFQGISVIDTGSLNLSYSRLFDSLVAYVLFWIVPAVGPNMFLMRFRGIAEHGLSRQLNIQTNRQDSGMYYTRSFLTPKRQYSFRIAVWIERILIGSFNINYHHEHHLYPKVPWYNLPTLHALIGDQILKQNSDVYARGYFSAAMRNVLAEN